MKKLTINILSLLFIVAVSFTSSNAQFVEKIKSEDNDELPCHRVGSTPSYRVFLTNLDIIDAFPCDLHVGATNLATGQTTYEWFFAGDFVPVEIEGLSSDPKDHRYYMATGDLPPIEPQSIDCLKGFSLGLEVNFEMGFYCLNDDDTYTEIDFCESEVWNQHFAPYLNTPASCKINGNFSYNICCNAEGPELEHSLGLVSASDDNVISSVVPTPTESIISFKNAVEEAEVITVNSINGQPYRVLSSSVNGNQINVNHQALPAGMYIMSIFSEGQVMSKKFVVM